jgi:16S rRNA processing protein RimM
MASPEPRVLLGEIVGVHGVDGLVRVRTHTAEPMDVAAYGPLIAEPGGRPLTLEALREAKGGVVVARVVGVTDRTAAEALRGLRLYVLRAALPGADEDEFYLADLEGLRAERPDGSVLGTVRRVVTYGAGDRLEIGVGTGSVLVPFTRAVVPVIDVAAGRVVVDPPEGLLPEDKAP